jgi:thymidylate synthase ThyX
MSSAKQVEREITNTPEQNDNAGTDVFVVHGVDPEVQAYAMAKYSRSALSMRESLQELNETRAEKFLNTFYFQYGHRSIADLAHIAMAIEKLSLLAATIVVDEQRWDGQERSTRYQDFKKSSYYVPKFGGKTELAGRYRDTIEFLFSEYREFSELMFQYLVSLTPKPEDMKQEAYERTLRARAFDISRYLLPMATNTSLGQIVNARTLETQVSRLLSDPHAEVRELAAKMKAAAREPAYNVNHEAFRKLVEAIRAKDGSLGDLAEAQLLREVKASPTLVKYAEQNQYEMATRKELRQAARELMAGAAIEKAPSVDLLDTEPLEIELATTLLYEQSQYPYRQLRRAVEDSTESWRAEIIDLGMRHRGKHDELLRAFHAGQQFRFDILMDIGGYRDMHRHRRCTQIAQSYCFAYGYETPAEITAAGHAERYGRTMRRAGEVAHALALELEKQPGAETEDVQYMIPLAYRKRALFKMDFAEVVYISELRTTPAGHYSYRKVAWEMYDAVAKRHPALAKYFRVHDIHAPVDLLQR